MKHFASPAFWKAYEKLPAMAQKQADKSFTLLKQDAAHPSLQLKQIGRFWSVRVSLAYRALAVEDNGDLVWFWIGGHDEYERMLGRSA